MESVFKEKEISFEKVPLFQMPLFDIEKLLAEEKELEDSDAPFLFGRPFFVSYSLEDGQWEDYKEGRIWSISFNSTNALSLNFILNDFYIPEGGFLYIVNKKQNVLYGPVSHKDTKSKCFFLTDIIPGDCATFLLYEPDNQKGESSLKIERVVHGYRAFFFGENYGNYGSSASCNVDVACRSSFIEESKAVGLVMLSNGCELCSGSLLMTTDMSFKPYFLTAFHCIDLDNDLELSTDEISSAENWLFMFNYRITECDGSTIASSMTYNSAYFRSAWYSTDFALMEIASTLQDNHDLTWLGWDRTGNTPSSGNCIHHPCGDVMKINTTYTSFDISSWNGTNNHWYVNWDEGITQGGSSGAPFLNQNKLVVGQNHGKRFNQDHLPLCDRKRSDAGMFHLSWVGGGSNNSRLSNWLDPIGTGLMTIESNHPIYMSGSTIPGCPSVYYVNNLPANMTVTWSLQDQNSLPNYFTVNYPTTNQLQIDNSNHNHIKGTLVAKIYNSNNVLIKTLTKYINTADGFSGSYLQTVPTPYQIISGSFYDGSLIHVKQGLLVYLTSSDFNGATVSCTSSNPPMISTSGNTVSVYFHNSTNFSSATLHCVKGDKVIEFRLRAEPILQIDPILHLMANINGGNSYINITLSENVDSGQPMRGNAFDSWELTIYSYTTGKVVHRQKVSGRSVSIDTSAWEPDTYIVLIWIDDKEIVQKISIE